MKVSSVACGFSPVEIDYSDYPKIFISRLNEVYFFHKYRRLLRNVATVCFAAIKLVISLAWFL